MRLPMRRDSIATSGLGALLVVALVPFASQPQPPDWQAKAQGALDHASRAYLEGNSKLAATGLDHADAEIARTGRPDLLARAELMRCASQVASLVFDPCSGFEALRPDAQAAERAYADYLAARIGAQDSALLPPHHRPLARPDATPAADMSALQEMSDPLAGGSAVLLQAGRANPAVTSLAIDTASTQGWRRPLLAWLQVQLSRVEQAGDSAEAARVRRRIALAQGAP
jgi:hypothetical protein